MTQVSSYEVAATLPVGPARAVSWGAVFAGAVASAAITLMLLTAGAGLGLVSISPWGNQGASAATLGISAIVWLGAIHLIALGVGGYLAGRLRTGVPELDQNEARMRDTAHGFLAWAVGSLLGAMLLASAAASIIGGTARLGASTLSTIASTAGMAGAGAAASSAAQGGPSNPISPDLSNYLTDSLFRGGAAQPAPSDAQAARAEVGRIVAVSLRNGDMSEADRVYVARVIAAQAGIPEAEARKRVDDTIQQAKDTAAKAEQAARQAAETARKIGAQTALASFIAMVIGAMAASFAAGMGGRARDRLR